MVLEAKLSLSSLPRGSTRQGPTRAKHLGVYVIDSIIYLIVYISNNYVTET